MPIKIVKKGAVSNETKTHPEKPTQTPVKVLAEPPASGDQPVPFIDKMSIVVDITDPTEAQLIHSSIWSLMGDASVFTGATKAGKYQVSKRLALDCLALKKPTKRPLLQYRHYDKLAVQLRLEFSPVDLGLDGLNELHAILVTIIPDGWPYVVKHGRITMIEVSVDLPNIEVGGFHVLPQQVATARTWSTGGKLQTLILGKPTGNQTRIYDRLAKRKAQGQSSPKYQGTRVERRLRPSPSLPFAKLLHLENPFIGISLVVEPPGKPPGEPKDYMWEMFRDTVRLRTLPVALKLLPEEKRTLYRKWLKQHPVDWWNPAKIWSHWPTYLVQTGLIWSST